jgi:hypothetical protein
VNHLSGRPQNGEAGPRKPDQPEIVRNFEANIGFAPKQTRVDQSSSRLTQKGLRERAEWLASGVENAIDGSKKIGAYSAV